MKAASLVAATLACAALSAVPAAAQIGSAPVRSDTRGFGLGVQFNGTQVGLPADSLKAQPGAGMGLAVSYGTSDALSLFARGSYGYRSSQGDLGARYRFRSPSAALRPYVEGAVTYLAAARPADPRALTTGSVRSSGLGMTLGAGVEYFVSPRLALDVGVAHTRGRFSDGTIVGGASGVIERFNSNRVQIGVTWRP